MTEQAVHEKLTRPTLKTPKAAAIAGIVFSVLLTSALLLLRISVPVDPLAPGAWLAKNEESIVLALNLIPFAGISFLWFMGVLRDRLGEREDKFFATVFFGSGILFLAMLFTASAVVGAIILAFRANPQEMIDSATFYFARSLAYSIANVYMIKIAAVFIVSTSTVTIYTGATPRWIAFVGYALALFVLLGSAYIEWSFLVFPLWIFALSVYIFVDNLRQPSSTVP
jgi:hypothetical protein